MQPPFDLNLMKTTSGRDTRELIAKAEAAFLLKRNRSRSIALAHGRRIFQFVWNSLKEYAAAKPVRLPF